jgi:hypothetical protein
MTPTDSYREVIEFLLDPGNIESAFDLVEVFPVALDRLQVKFWDTLKLRVEQKLAQRQAAGWFVRLVTGEKDPAEGVDFLKPGYSHLEVAPVVDDEMRVFSCFWVEQKYRTSARKQPLNDTAELFYGFGFSKQLSKREQANLPKEVKLLRDKIGEDWISYRDQFADGWLARKKLNYRLRDRNEMALLAQGDGLEEDVAGAFLNLFDEKRDEMEAINAAFRKSKG